ncbi:MAG: FtsW/RodA/SpoVE family cell cycle protein [Erysipelotrichaceae bacterium]
METNKRKKKQGLLPILNIFRIHPRQDLGILVVILLLASFGSMMVISTSVGMTSLNSTIVLKTLIKQVAFVVSGMFVYMVCSNLFSLPSMNRYIKIFGFVIMALLIYASRSTSVNGASAWISFGSFTLQPSEFAKVFIIVMFAGCAYEQNRRKVKLFDIYKIPFFFFCSMVFVVWVMQNDMGTALVMVFLGGLLFLIPTDESVRPYQKALGWIFLIAIGVIILFLAIPKMTDWIQSISFLDDYQKARFLSALDPFYDPLRFGYQLINSLYAFTSGGIRGLGLGNSIQKFGYLPEAGTDYILAITVEELGLFGFFIIIFGYLYIIHRMIQYALKTDRVYEKVILIGVTSYLFIHFFLNVGGVIGLIPLTGVPLLFISGGGSSLWAIMASVGIGQSVIVEINQRERRKRKQAMLRSEVEG